MATIQERVGELVVLRCWCGIQCAVPQSLRDEQMRTFNQPGATMVIFCPLGHTFVPGGESELDRVKRQLKSKDDTIAYERSRHDQTKAKLRDTEARRRAEKGAKTRLKNRVANGICPCCNRHFENLERHMKGQHPDFRTEAGEERP